MEVKLTMGSVRIGEANCPRKMKVVNKPKILPLLSGVESVTRHKLEFGIIKPAPAPAMNNPGNTVK